MSAAAGPALAGARAAGREGRAARPATPARGGSALVNEHSVSFLSALTPPPLPPSYSSPYHSPYCTLPPPAPPPPPPHCSPYQSPYCTAAAPAATMMCCGRTSAACTWKRHAAAVFRRGWPGGGPVVWLGRPPTSGARRTPAPARRGGCRRAWTPSAPPRRASCRGAWSETDLSRTKAGAQLAPPPPAARRGAEGGPRPARGGARGGGGPEGRAARGGGVPCREGRGEAGVVVGRSGDEAGKPRCQQD